MPGGTPFGLYYLRYYPDQSQCCGWTNPWESYDHKTPSATTRELFRNKVYYSLVLEGTRHVQAHTERLQVERESTDLGFSLNWGQRQGA